VLAGLSRLVVLPEITRAPDEPRETGKLAIVTGLPPGKIVAPDTTKPDGFAATV